MDYKKSNKSYNFYLNYYCSCLESVYILSIELLFQEKLFHFWFNTFFVCEPAVTENGNRENKHCGQQEKSGHTNGMDDSTNFRFPNNQMR